MTANPIIYPVALALSQFSLADHNVGPDFHCSTPHRDLCLEALAGVPARAHFVPSSDVYPRGSLATSFAASSACPAPLAAANRLSSSLRRL